MPNGKPTPHFGAVAAARASTFDWFWSSRIWLLYRNRVKPGKTRPIIPFHAEARMGRLSLTMAWWAVCSAMFYIVVGASLALSYGARNALIGMVLSVISYGLVNSVLSRFAIRSGLSVALFSRLLFGSTGACLATLIFFSTAIYYAVFEGSVIAVALNHLYPELVYPLAALLVVLYSVPMILGSVQHWLDKLNGVLLPVYLGGLLVAVGLSISRYGYQPQWLDFGPATPSAFGWWDCFVAYMGVWVLMLFTFDYARFGKPEDAEYHGRWNFGMPFYAVTFLLNGAAGIYLVSSIPHEGALNEVSVVHGDFAVDGPVGIVVCLGHANPHQHRQLLSGDDEHAGVLRPIWPARFVLDVGPGGRGDRVRLDARRCVCLLAQGVGLSGDFRGGLGRRGVGADSLRTQ